MDIDGGWALTERRFLNDEEVQALRRIAHELLELSGWKKRSVVYQWIAIEIALHTGLRVGEIAALRCGDLWFGREGGSLLVRNGKGGRRRSVKFGAVLSMELSEFLSWKQIHGQSTDEEEALILSENTGGHITTRGLQKMFCRVARLAGVLGHRFHDLRHTYASRLYRASGNNLRLVQKQLGHASVRTTEIYADVLDGEAEKAINALYE